MQNRTKPDHQAQTDAQQTPPAGGRQPYRRPELVEYGSVAKLSRGSMSQNSDAPSAGHKSNQQNQNQGNCL